MLLAIHKKILCYLMLALFCIASVGCVNIKEEKTAAPIEPAPCECEELSPGITVVGEVEHVLVGSELMLQKARIGQGEFPCPRRRVAPRRTIRVTPRPCRP